MRRLFDIIVSLAGLLALSPLLLLIVVAIKIESRGSVFFLGPRVGKEGKPFRLVKFRTMVSDAAARGPGITTSGDARITRVGRWLRKLKLDEFPQLWNVVRGEMTFVGPRPEDPRYVAQRPELYRKSLELTPGITGAGSLLYRHEEAALKGKDLEKAYFGEILPRKLAADLDYAQKQNLLRDIGMVLKTVGMLLR